MLKAYFLSSVDYFRSRYTNPGFIICGDFNTFNTEFFGSALKFKLKVDKPTRGDRILDMFFTNCDFYYKQADILPPLGRSDHNCLFMSPSDRPVDYVGTRTSVCRDFTPSALEGIARDLSVINWSGLYHEADVQYQADIFYNRITSIVDYHAPQVVNTVKNNDRPWVSRYFKRTIGERDKAFKLGNAALYRKLRNKINRLRKSLCRQFVDRRIVKMQDKRGKVWWRDIKAICGMANVKCNVFDDIRYKGTILSHAEIPDAINQFLVSVCDDVPVLSECPNSSETCRDLSSIFFEISEFDVYCVLSKLNVSKASLDGTICNKMLKDSAELLAAPICAIINNSLSSGKIPSQWRVSRVSPIPKCSPMRDIETDVRPIAITCPVSKVIEVFAATLFAEYYEDEDDQFGSVAGRSTTLALIKLTHLLFEASDIRNNIIRILFIDFSRAFELIDHNVIRRKFDNNKFPTVLKDWFLSFLSNRSQFVKIGDCFSSVCNINAGAPQGTRAGPNCFKMLIKDLAFKIPCIKYVDDVTVFSTAIDCNDDSLQQALDDLLTWCDSNGMRLNLQKTKEMVVSFSGSSVPNACESLKALSCDIDRVSEFKLLGVILSADLSWTKHVNYIVTKASKRIFALCQLVRCGFSHTDVVSVYCSLIRPLLEYASQVWHSGLTQSLSDEVEFVQRRCMRIVFPQLSYADALFVAGLQRLDVRREAAVIKTFGEIKNHSHILHNLLPLRSNTHRSNTRFEYPYENKRTRTVRGTRSMISYCIGRRL